MERRNFLEEVICVNQLLSTFLRLHKRCYQQKPALKCFLSVKRRDKFEDSALLNVSIA